MLRFSAFGVRVEVGGGFVFGLLPAGAANAWLEYATLPVRPWGVVVASGVAAALAFALSLFAHELGHALAARARRIPVRRIRLSGSGGACERGAELRSPMDEFVVVAAGPATSALLGLASLLLGMLALSPGTALRSALMLSAFYNAMLAIANLVPIYPLDGGKLVHSLLWRRSGDARRARRRSVRLGRLTAALVVVAGVGICTVGADFAVGSVVSMTGAYLLRFAAAL